MHHSCLCDSSKNLISAKPGSQVVDKKVFRQSACRDFLISDMLKAIWKLMCIMISIT